jgi:hypothetical protein
MRSKEDDMTGTLNPACPLCGLRFASRPLLELHIREDHRQRRTRAGRRDPGGTRATRLPAGSPSRRPGLASRPSRTTKEVTAMTATRDPRARQMRTALQVRIALRRAVRALRQVNDELLLASEAIIRSARAPRPRPQVQAPAAKAARPHTVAERTDRAA